MLKKVDFLLNKYELLIFLIILAFGMYWRLVNIIDVSYIFSDSGRDLLVAKHMASYGENLLVTPDAAGGFTYLNNTPFYFWLLALFYLITGSVEGVIIVYALASCLVIILAYLFSKQIFKNWSALFLPYFLSISSIFISYSKYIWQPHLLPLFQILSLLFLVKGNQAQKKYLFWSLQIAFLAFYLHLSYLAFLIITFIFIVFKLIKWKLIKDILKLMLLTTLNIMLFFYLSNGFNNNSWMEINNLFIGGNNPGLISINNPLESYFNNLTLNLSIIFKDFSIASISPLFALLVFCLFLIIIYILFIADKKNKNYDYYLLFFLMLCSIFPISTYFQPLAIHHLIPINLLILIFIAAIFDKLKKHIVLIFPIFIIVTFILGRYRSNMLKKNPLSSIEIHKKIAQKILEYNDGLQPMKIITCFDFGHSCSFGVSNSSSIWLYLENLSNRKMGSIQPSNQSPVDNFLPYTGEKNEFLVCTYDAEQCLIDSGLDLNSIQVLEEYQNGTFLLLKEKQ